MRNKRFRLIYDTEFPRQIAVIKRKYHSLIRTAIEQQLIDEPEVETGNRKSLTRTTNFGARWELRIGERNEIRVFYSVYSKTAEVHILAIGIKIRNRLYIGGKEVKL